MKTAAWIVDRRNDRCANPDYPDRMMEIFGLLAGDKEGWDRIVGFDTGVYSVIGIARTATDDIAPRMEEAILAHFKKVMDFAHESGKGRVRGEAKEVITRYKRIAEKAASIEFLEAMEDLFGADVTPVERKRGKWVEKEIAGNPKDRKEGGGNW